MPAEITSSFYGRSHDRVNLPRSARGTRSSAARQSIELIHIRDERPGTQHNVRGNTTANRASTYVQKRSRTVSPNRRITVPKETNVETARDKKDAVKNTNLRERPKSSGPKKDRNKTKKKSNEKCIALIEEVSKKILEVNDQLNARDVKVLIDLLKERLMTGANCVNETELYREDSDYRLIKSEHQHQKVMLHCGMKKRDKEQGKSKWTKNAYDDIKSKHGDTDYIKYSGNMDAWDPVAEADKVLKKYKSVCNNGEISKVSKALSKKRVPSVKFGDDKQNADEDLMSLEDLNTWNKLPDAVDKLMTYFDGFTTENRTEKPQKEVKRYSDVSDRREKIKLWDMQRRLTLGLKLETRALQTKPVDSEGEFLVETTSTKIY